MEIKQLESKEKVLTFFGELKGATVESAIKEIVKINLSDQEYLKQCRQWALDNGQNPSPAKLTPIEFYLSTYGGACYDGLALHDVLESSITPIEVICTGKLTAPTNEFVGFYPSASTEALMEYRDSPSRSMFCAAFSSLSWCVPHSGQTQSRTDRFLTRTFL